MIQPALDSPLRVRRMSALPKKKNFSTQASPRATNSGIRISRKNAAIALGMYERKDRIQDIAAYFGWNPGRVYDILDGKIQNGVQPAPSNKLPAPGPYRGEYVVKAKKALTRAMTAIRRASRTVDDDETKAALKKELKKIEALAKEVG